MEFLRILSCAKLMGRPCSAFTKIINLQPYLDYYADYLFIAGLVVPLGIWEVCSSAMKIVLSFKRDISSPEGLMFILQRREI